MNRPQWLADDIATEINQLRQVGSEIASAQSRIAGHDPDTFEMRSLASMVHDIYNGVERVFRRITKETGEGVPSGDNWHRVLMTQMTQEVSGVRPAVISEETAALLDAYRGFRHRVRHGYGFDLKWSRMKPLAIDAEQTIESLSVDLEAFIDFLQDVAGH